MTSVDETVLFYLKEDNKTSKGILDRSETGEGPGPEYTEALYALFCFACADFLTRLQLKSSLNSANF